MARVSVTFDGNNRGAVEAARGTVAAVDKLKRATAEQAAEARLSAEANAKAEREISRLSRGALAGSGIFQHLGRSVAFASGAFLGAAGFTEVVRSSVDAAEALEKAHRGLDAQIRANNQNVKAAAPLIAATDAKMAKLGDTATESEGALARLSRATGDVVEGTKLMGLTADLAAARHIDLSQAAVLVGKVYDGNVSALNRYGIAIAKGTSVTDALRIAQQKLGGQAEANVTPLEKLHAVVTNTEATIGGALLPTINKYSDELSTWLGKSANQEKIQRDVNEAMRIAAEIIAGATPVVREAAGVASGFADAVGGWKNAAEIVLAGTLASKLGGVAKEIGLVGKAAETAGAEKGVGGLLGGLRQLAGLAAIAVSVDLIVNKSDAQSVKRWLDTLSVDARNKVHDALAKAGLGALTPAVNDFGKGPFGTNPATGGGGNFASAPKNKLAAGIVKTAQSQIGIPYQYNGPAILNQHTDCSGLAQAVLRANGINVPRTTFEQWAAGRPVDMGHLQPGDLIFYEPSSRGPQHVAIYIGGGQVVVDPHTGVSVMQTTINGAGQPVGARRFTKNMAAGGTGGGSPGDVGAGTPPPPAAPPKAKKTPVVSGLSLLPSSLRNALASYASLAKNSAGATAVGYLHDELGSLEDARAELQKRLGSATGKQKTAIEAEITSIDGKIRDVNTAIKTSLAGQAKAVAAAVAKVKSAYASQISAAQSTVGTMFNRIQQDVDGALQAHFDDQVRQLGDQLFQNAGQRTPLEQQLADMQAVDERAGRQSTVDQAKAKQVADQQAQADAATLAQDQADIDQAQRAYDEGELAIRATAERAKADKDYADQLDQLKREQQLQQQRLNSSLDDFGKRLQDGSATIGDLNSILAPFGISVASIPADQLAYDMDNLSAATQALAKVFVAESAALAALGASADARAAADQAAAIDPAIGNIPTGAGTTTSSYSIAGTIAAAAAAGKRITHPLPKFAGGGLVAGPRIPRDRVPILASGGERMVNEEQQAWLERVAGGGARQPAVIVFEVNGREFARATVDDMTAAQGRRISYRSQRS